MVDSEWTYEPEAERWIRSKPDPEPDCVLVPLREGSGVEFTNRYGWKIGWCETCREAEWMPNSTIE